jgi:hypothetical protein
MPNPFANYDQWKTASPYDNEPDEGEGREIHCDVCDAVETVSDHEVTEETLEGEGWYLGPASTLCPDHNEDDERES